MASVTSGLSATDSQNIIRATDALNKLTRSINSLEITNRELVKSTIRFNALNKSIDNLDRRINQVRTSFTKIENKKTTQAVNSHSSELTKKPAIDAVVSSRDPHQTYNPAANAIRQSFIDKDIFINSRDLYKTSNANIQKDIIDSIAAISGMAGPELSVPVSLISIQAKRMIDDNEDVRNYERNKISGFLSDYSNLENYKSYDEFDRQRSTLETAEKMQSVLLGQVDEISKAIEKLNKNKKNLSAGSTASAVDELGNIFSYNIPARPELIPKIDGEIYELEKQKEKANKALDATKGMVEEVKNNVANAFKIPSTLNLEGRLADSSTLSDKNTTKTQTSITSFESGQYQFDSFRESSGSSRFTSEQAIATFESDSARSSSESIARDIVTPPKTAYDLIDEREAQQFKDIESLNTYAQSTEDYRLYQEARVEIAAQASDARQSIRQNEEQMDRQATLNGLNDMNSAVTGLMGIAEAARGKQSGTYKALFAMSKAFNVAQATLNLQSAIMGAMNSPDNVTVAQKFASMAAVASAGVQLLSSITSITMSGQAHAGIDYIPREGTWLLDRGERVVDSRTNADLKQYLSKNNGGSGGGSSVSVNIPLSIQSEGSGSAGVTAEDASLLAGMIKSKVYEIVSNEQRPGGLLSRG